MKLIVGLGNPGKEYDSTRHNVGFFLIDNYAKNNNMSIDKEKFNGKYNQLIIGGEKVILLKPQSYMNLSGGVVRKYVDFFKIALEDILIISDDLDMPIGKIKLRPTGSSGGHNGLKDIERNLNSKNYKRLKIGISNNKNIDTKDYVLGKFSKEEQKILDEIKTKSNSILNDFINGKSFDNLMNLYNRN